MQGTRLSHYTMLEQIGAGGMGVVYRARDDRLEREVAIKVLPQGMLGDATARRRFRKEALALSQLNHPNIASVYDFDTDRGVDFLVMELIAGETLDLRLARGRLSEAELLPIAHQTAEALALAHERGVVHRDLKPGNLRLTPDGRVKVLDFGIARRVAVNAGATATLTAVGAAAGTLAYMAPETLGGERGDERGDLYSLGVVLYELATGRRPFEGDSALRLMYAVLHETPAPLRSLNPGISPGLERTILRLLDREPGRRHGSARELLADLRAAGSAAPASARDAGAAGAGIRSLAVLPLENLSGDPSQEFFADGMTEALIADLARIRELRVISRTSVMRYKGARRPIPEIAAELNVDAVLEGSVARSGDRVRVTAQLIEARSDTHLWAERYDRAMQDVLELQSDVAQAIAREIHVAVSPGASAPPRAARKVDPGAYESWLRGRQFWARRDEEGLRRAIEHFQAAIERAPAYAMAHVGLAEAFGVMGFQTFLSPEASFPRARAAALRALELDPDAGEAHNALGYARLFYEWDLGAAERDFRRAIESNPSYGTAHLWYANLLVVSGRFEEARQEGRKARELDPLSLIPNAVTGWGYFFARNYEGALEELRRPLEIAPGFVYAHAWLGWTWQMMGRLEEASAALETAARSSDHEPTALVFRALSQALAGRPADARRTLEEREAMRPKRYVSAFNTVLVHLALGDREGAFRWLEQAVAERGHWLMFMNVDPRLDPLRGDARFDDLRRRVGLI